ncbi:MAG: hypothetical protein E7076_08325, partial [Bacteroidales bacterium]|nr:hypothetical protein [Bacteroidales bacterium]
MKRFILNYAKNILVLLFAWAGVMNADATNTTLYVYGSGWENCYINAWTNISTGYPGTQFSKVVGTSDWWEVTINPSGNIPQGNYFVHDYSSHGIDKYPTNAITNGITNYIVYINDTDITTYTDKVTAETAAGESLPSTIGLTKLDGPFLISGQGTSDYAYADGTNISVTSNVANTSALGSEYMWDIYTVDAIAAGSKGRFTIVNVSTGEFMNIPTTKGNPFTLVDSQSTTTEITLWDYSTSARATDANASAGLANTNIQGLDADNYKGIIKKSKLYVKDSESTGHFTFTKTSYPSSGPTVPTNVAAARASATSVTVSWDEAEDADGYRVYKSTDGSSWDSGTSVVGGNVTSYTSTGLTSDIRYYYKVTTIADSDESSASSVVSTVPGTLPSNLAFVAGPFMIRNNYTGFGYQYLYDNTTGNDYTGEEANDTSVNPSPSDATSYSHYGRVLRNKQDADSDATYLTNANYMWDIYSYVIGGNTYYALRNAATGRYMHTGAYTDWYGTDGNNNSINVFAWNSTNVAGATAINGDSNANKELSYYLYNFKVGAVQDVAPSSQADVAVNASGFTAQIMTQRFAWGQRVLHGEYSGDHTNDSRGSMVFATDNHYGWGTKSWLFTTATRPAPTGLTATPGATTADLAWNATEGTLIYTVYRSTTEGSGYAEIGTTTTNSYADSGLTKGTTYYYKVTATAGTSTSAQSAAVSVTTLNVPAAPTNVAAAPDCSATDKIIVTWDAVAGATSYDIEAYDNGTSQWYDKGLDITATTATITVAGGYKAYPIHVKAKNAAGSSAWANAAADGWPASPSPTLTVSGTTAASVTLAWTDIAGQTYDVYRSAYVDGNYKLLASGQSNGYTDNAVFSGSKYYYKLKVTDATCGTRWSNAVNATTGYTLGTPVASVTSKTASEVTIGWSAVAGARAYNIYRSVDNVNYDYIGLTKETTYTDNLNRGNGLKTIYYYKVTAVEDGMEQWFYKGGTSRETATPLYVYADGDHIGSWYPDGHEYIYINGNIYYTYINSKQDSCWTVGGLSGGLAHFRETAALTGEYKAVVYSAETYNNDGYITFRLATDSAAVLNNATAYVAWNNVAIAPKCTTCSDNNGWQNYLPYVGAFPMTAGTNELYISPSGSLNFMKIVLSAGESDFSLAVPAEYIPQPVRQNPTINSMTSSTINWNAIEGAKYKIRFSPNFTKIENTSTNRWGIGQEGEDENGWITVNTNAYTLVAMSPTWQYRYEVKAFDESTGVESTVMSEDGCWISSRDYAPILTTSTSGQNITVTISDSKASEIKDYTLYYSKDKTTWTNVTVTKAASSYTLAGDPATLYFFKATATDAATDSISMPSVTVWAQTEEVTPALSIAGTTLSWTAVSNASKYSVMRKTGTGEYTKIGETADGSTLTYTDNSIEGGTNYTYKIVPTSAHCDIFVEWAYNEDGSANMVPNNEKNWGKDGKGTKYIDGVYYNTGEHYTAGNAGAWMKFTINAAYATNYTADAYIARERAYTITNYLSTNGTSGSKISSFEGPNLSGGPNRTGGCYGFGNGWQNYHVYTGNNPVAMTGESQDIYFTSGSCNFMKLVFWVNDFQTEGTASNEVEITTPPAITTVECNGGNSLVVEWSYNAEADSFRIYRSNTENGVYTQIARTEGTIKTYTDNTITFGDTYYYKVSAITGGGALTIADVMAQYASANDYALIVTDGAKGSDAANLYRTSATVIDGNNYITSGVTATNAHWSQECILEANPYQKNSAITSYIVTCARLTEGTLNANDGICLVPNGYPDNMTSHANFKNIADYAALSTTEDTWFVIPTGTSGNSWIRTGIADADQNVAFRHIIYAASAPSLSTTEESDKSAAVAGGCTTMADTIIWTGSAATDAWNDIDNWDIIENGETRAIEASDAFGTPLTVIMPAELGTPTFDGGLGRINAASDIVLAYGALFDMDGFEDASGVCHSLTTSLVVRGEDRGEWILAGPNLKMKEGDGTREQLSGDYYLNKLPWVYMHEISIEQGENPTISWQNAFPQLTEVLTPESAFAIRVDNKYGKYGINSERYYSKDSVKKHLGEQDVVFTFEGMPYPTPTFNVPAGKWTVITNTTTGNISIADLLSNEGGQAAVWNFNTGSKGNKGSWNTYANAAAAEGEGVYVIPATAFLYKPATDMTADQVLAYTDYTLSGKYHVTAALDGVPDPTLTLTASNGKYAAQTSVTYNAFISDEETEEPTNNALKVFSSYDGVPDICSYNGGTAYFSRTVNGSTTVPLGVSATSDMTFTLTAQGAENFKAAVLDDRLTGLSYNLKTQAALEFDIEAGENKDRFFLNLEYDDTLQPTTDIDENTADD